MFAIVDTVVLSFAIFSSALAVKPQTPAQVAAAQWQALNTTVQGRLHTSAPFARPCFNLSTAATGAFDTTACSQVQSHFLDANLRTATFGSYINTQWETCQATSAQCSLDWTNPTNPVAFSPPASCSQGSVPPYFIDVKTVSDVQAAFAFSKKTGVPIVIKNTGHDYVGRSSQANSLALWSHNLKSLSYQKKFVAQGCSLKSAGPAVIIGGGVQHAEVYNFADANGVSVPGGASATVGAAGGYLQGGGHSWLSNIHGLAVDRALEFEVVTPTGKHLFANACQNQDLFFALRGGGGGTFGFVMAATTKALPKTSYTSVQMTYTANATTLPKFLSFLISNSVQWSKDGWSGQIRPSAKLVMTNVGKTEAQATSYWQSLRTLAEKELNGTFSVTTTPSYLAFHNTFVVPDAANDLNGVPQAASSRLIPAAALSSQADKLLPALVNLFTSAPVGFIFANAPYSFRQDVSIGPTSVTPAWRNSIWHVAAGNAWTFDTPLAAQKAIIANLTASVDQLRKITPTSGAYQNEADLHEPNFTESFWGNNYQRLVQIKRKYDPDQILNCWHCVGWTGATDSRFSCYV